MNQNSTFKKQWALLKGETGLADILLQQKLEHYIFRQYERMILAYYIKISGINKGNRKNGILWLCRLPYQEAATWQRRKVATAIYRLTSISINREDGCLLGFVRYMNRELSGDAISDYFTAIKENHSIMAF